MNNASRNILVLTGDAGLGHRSAAEAIRNAIKDSFGERCKIMIINPIYHPTIPNIFRESQSDYDIIVKKIPELYKFAYEISDSNLPVKLMESGLTLIFFQVLREILSKFKPNIVITTYPIFIAPLAALSLLKEMTIPWITVVTDLVSVHHIWFNKYTTICTVPTEAVKKKAIAAGLKSEKIKNTGIPVNPEIAVLKQIKKEVLRRDLGWDIDKVTLLVVGSPRMKSIIEFICALDETDHKIQFVIVAGGNDDQFQIFKESKWRHPTKVYNFVDNLPEMMRAADMIICKAGGLIVTESLASGLPLMLIHMLPGQEKGNMDYVVEHQAGVYCDTPQKSRITLDEWLADRGEKLQEISKNAEKIGRPDAAGQIATEAWNLCNQ